MKCECVRVLCVRAKAAARQDRGFLFLRCVIVSASMSLVGSLKLYVSFAEYRLFYRVFLQKRPITSVYPIVCFILFVVWMVLVCCDGCACEGRRAAGQDVPLEGMCVCVCV